MCKPRTYIPALFLFYFIHFYFIGVLPVYMSVQGCWILELQTVVSCSVGAGIEPRSLKEQSVLLASEPSLQTLYAVF